MDGNWEIYVPMIVQTDQVPPETRAELDALRDHMLDEYVNQGMGLKSEDDVYETFKVDADAISDFLGAKPFFMGDKPRSIDANVFAILTHTIEAPFEWPGKDYIASKANLTGYLDRMRGRYNLEF